MKKRFRLKVHPAGIALLAAAFLFADSRLALAVFLALALHEGAHLIAMTLCEIKGCTVEITPFGGMMDVGLFDRYPPWKQLLASGAGVAASGLAAWICWRSLPNTLFIQRFFQANLSLAFLNLLPLWPLDGARMITAAASYLGMEQQVKKTLSFFSAVLGILLALLGLYGVWKGMANPTLLAAGPYLCYASRAEMVTSRVRGLGRIERKLSDGEALPVTIWAGCDKDLHTQFIRRLSQGTGNTYQVWLFVDPSTGQIQKWWTEHEAMNHLLSQDRN